MVSNPDLQRWQQAINGIEAARSNLTPDELSAFKALIELYNNGNFEASESGSYIQVIKNAVKQHTKNRLLKAHLTNFVTLCEKYFKADVAAVAPPAPVVSPPRLTPPVFEPPAEITTAPESQIQTFIAPPQVASADLSKWQQAIQGIEAMKSDLSPNELLAFKALVELYYNGNFETNESGGYIQTLKNSTTKNRLLKKIHLPNFVALCEKYFKMNPVTFQSPAPVVDTPRIVPPILQPPILQPPVAVTVQSPATPASLAPDENKSTTKERKNDRKPILIILVIVLLVGCWWIYNNWKSDSVLKIRDKFGLTSLDTTQNVPADTAKQIVAPTAVPDTVPMTDTIVQIVTNDNKETVDKKMPAAQEEQRNPVVKTYSFGKYTGTLKNGIPEGDGKMTYSRRVQIAKHDTENPPHYAEPGDYFIGSWGNGDIVSGRLYNSSGIEKERILAPKRFNVYDISKD